jgi:hypothetical protein
LEVAGWSVNSWQKVNPAARRDIVHSPTPGLELIISYRERHQDGPGPWSCYCLLYRTTTSSRLFVIEHNCKVGLHLEASCIQHKLFLLNLDSNRRNIKVEHNENCNGGVIRITKAPFPESRIQVISIFSPPHSSTGSRLLPCYIK